MITYEAIKSLEGINYETFNELKNLAKEAEDAEKLIKSTWKFQSEEKIIDVLEGNESGNTREFLTIDRLWVREEGGNSYSGVQCSADKIFECFVAEFLFKNNYGCVREDADETVKKAEMCSYLRGFLERSKEKAQTTCK